MAQRKPTPPAARTVIRAWPLPDDVEHSTPLCRLLAPLIHKVHDVPGNGRVLVVVAPNAPGGIDAHPELIGALHDAGANVYAINSEAPGVPARFEYCRAGGARARRRMDENGAPLVTHGELIRACVDAGGVIEGDVIGLEQISDAVIPRVVRELFAQPALPCWVMEPGREWGAETQDAF